MRDRTENQVILALIRHGETPANRERRYLGKTDEPLSERGRKALLSCKERNGYPKVQYLFASPMARCLETARILYPELTPVIIPEWKEMDFGRFEYKNYEDLKSDAQYQAWIDSGGALDFPGGESRKDFILRCEQGFEKMCDVLRRMAGQSGEEPVRAGMIVHGGTIMALLSSHGGKGYFDCQVSNGRGYICRMTGWGSDARIEEEVKI